MQSLLKVNDIVVAYGTLDVLHQVTIEVLPGDMVSVLGANGAGKTTLLQAISGLLPIKSGNINFAGQDISGDHAHELPGLGMAHVPQGRGIFTTLSVLENLRIGAWNPRARQKSRESIEMAHELFPMLKERQHQIAGSLSGGEQQMLALARALSQNPTLLMLDEPSLGLAPVIVDSVFEALGRIKQEGIAILLVEQDVFHATEMASRCYLLENGTVTLEGSKAEFERSPIIKKSYLGI